MTNCFYRVSVKALVLNKTRDKFLLCKKDSGVWELPGGGLDWGASPHEDLRREIKEEMNVGILWIADNPAYFITRKALKREGWNAYVLYETELESLDFIPSRECEEIRFVDKNDVKEIKVLSNIEKLVEMFKSDNHKRERTN